MAARKRFTLPGCIYKNGNRWWWKVRLPGESETTPRPLIPVGARFAATDEAVAREVAKQMYVKATCSSQEKPASFDGTIGCLVAMYKAFAREYYGQTPRRYGEADHIALAVTMLVEMFGTTPAEEFGPLDLKTLRTRMVEGGLKRKTINDRIGVIRRMFKWAASEELVPVIVWQGLTTVEGLRRGRTTAVESEPVLPVPVEIVEDTLPQLQPIIADMVRLQLLTAARAGEICQMRPMDIETGGAVWYYRPERHKTAHRGQKRLIAIGPKAQQILKPYLSRALGAYCFSPVESEEQRNAERRRHRQTKAWPSHDPELRRLRRGKTPARPPGEMYTTESYRKAIHRACDATWPPPKGCQDVAAWREEHRWNPHQLRHTAGTLVRKKLGLDAARALLGHRSLELADTYAELDRSLADEAARKLG
jgi:integrase